MSSAPIAQRRHLDEVSRQAEVQSSPEDAVGDPFVEIGVRRGDHAHVHAPRVAGAHGHDLAVLEHAKQLRLERRRHVADLVQEERAAVRQLEPSLAVGRGARERAADVAEQHRFGQLGRYRDAVHRNERPPAPAGCCSGSRAPPAPCRCRSLR